MDKVLGLLNGNYWVINLDKWQPSQMELIFLKNFFEIYLDKFIDETSLKERNFLILRKKPKFQPIH